MPAPHRPAPPERPDQVVLLIDAVINRQADLAQRLAQQWIHRQGLAAFATLGRNRLAPTCGEDGVAWLQTLLGLQTGQPAGARQQRSATPAPEALGLGSLIREALTEALQPLRQDAIGQDQPRQQSAQLSVAAAGVDPWSLPPMPSVGSSSRDAAPPPADLAGLRAWLHSDAA